MTIPRVWEHRAAIAQMEASMDLGIVTNLQPRLALNLIWETN